MHAAHQNGAMFTQIAAIAAGDFRNTRPNSVAAVGVEIIGRPLTSLPHGAGEDDTYDWGQSA